MLPSPKMSALDSDDNKTSIESPGLIYKMKQLKSAVLSEFRKLSAFNQSSLTCTLGENKEETSVQEAPVNEAICEICTNPLTGTAVFSCRTCFNLMCAYCLTKVRKCPFCRSSGMFADRNQALERFLTTLNLPCRNQRHGCKEYVDRNTRKQHEKNCKFTPFYCLHFPSCGWSGNSNQLMEHLQNDHFTKLIQSDHAQVKIRHVWAKLKSPHHRRKGYFIIYCHGLVFGCMMTLIHGCVIISFVQMKSYDPELDRQHFGVGIEVNSVNRTVRGIIPLPAPNKIQCISISPKFLLLPDDNINDNIVITIDIKNLDSLLSE